MREPVFTETLQVAIVVRDLEAAMRTYVHDYRIGAMVGQVQSGS